MILFITFINNCLFSRLVQLIQLEISRPLSHRKMKIDSRKVRYALL